MDFEPGYFGLLTSRHHNPRFTNRFLEVVNEPVFDGICELDY